MKVLIVFIYLFCFSHCGSVVDPSKMSNELISVQTDTIPPLAGATSVLIVRGIMDAAGDKLLRIDSLIKRTYDLQSAIPDQSGGIFQVEILYENQDIQKVAFDALVAGDSDVVTHGFFELQIPVWTGIASIRIVKTVDGKLLHEYSKHEIP